ncbi:TerD family protein [Paenibacillus sp. 481]|uniref:TerD family protein n=1 Tax=Paenibacillus sp. 481 TaxID=2835869 RepID=UPI001E3E2590|nr:TerD family protein [Paenibacillus sp. 481]UHA73074.1 TerD family protein [Paenibacillus sp. 481]
MKNTIFLRRKNKTILHNRNSQLDKQVLATGLHHIQSLGYTLSLELLNTVKTLPTIEFVEWCNMITLELRKMLGANKKYTPMYPNFPSQVMSADDSELFLNALIHYLTGLLPSYSKEDTIPLNEQHALKVIDLGTDEEFDELIQHLIQAKTSISEQDKADIEWAICNYEHIEDILPEEIYLKENVGFVVALLIKYDKASINHVKKYVKTATDVLRLITSLSDGDVSLAANTKYIKFKRKERRMLLELLEKCPNLTEDMIRYKQRWIRIGEILHPNEYKHRFHKAREAFDIIRNNKTFETFNSKLEKYLAAKDTYAAVKLLETRSGEFARRLDHLLRISDNPTFVIESFAHVIQACSSPVLLQLIAHFSNRNNDHELRTFFPKGNVAKCVAIENQLAEIDQCSCDELVKRCRAELVNRFSNLTPLGKVYIDRQLHDFNVPFSQRSASKSLHTVARGSKLVIEAGHTIRLFTWWKEGTVNGTPTGRVDIDLSAVMYDEHWNYVEHISYTNLKSSTYRAAHSGDITSAPHGACEFIDLDIDSILKSGGRYVVASLMSFTDQAYCNLPECYVGWMLRDRPKSGEIFEPATVVNKIDVSADTQICIPVILDLAARKVIWSDLALRNHPEYHNNVEGNQQGMVLMGKAMTTIAKPTLYELFHLHALARGVMVDNREEADTVFSVTEGITPYAYETIIAEYL